MSRIAGALGRTEEQHQYEALAAKREEILE